MKRGPSLDRWLALALLCVAVGALAFRLPRLDRRPMHNDEAVNAILFRGLWERGTYRYDPDEYHGPTLHYAALPFVALSGDKDFDHLSERTLRWVTVAAGVALVLLVGLLRDGLGTTTTLVAACLLAVSPAMVFYSRYFIHEMLLVTFTLLFLGAAWRFRQSSAAGWAAVAGAGLGLMHATKETFVLQLAAMGLALAVSPRIGRRDLASPHDTPFPGNLRPFVLGLTVAAGVSVTLFTSFFTHLRGPLDAWLTYLPWLRRAGGASPHLHPWTDYFERLFWHRAERGPIGSEIFVALLAVVGIGVALTGKGLGDTKPGLARFLAVYTVLITAVYCAIPYKTPWCLLNFLLPTLLLAGLGAAALVRWAGTRPRQVAMSVVLALGGIHLAWNAWRASQEFATHRGNPYAYAQTVPNAVELADRVKAIARVSPQGMQTEVKVVAPESDYWPLPWYLRQLKTVWWLDRLPDDPYAPVMIVAARLRAGLDDRSNRRYLSVGYYELRPREFFELYVEFELWKKFVETLPRPKDDE